MKKAIIIFNFILLFSLSANAQKSEEFISLAKRMAQAQENYDPAALEKIYASDYIEISPIGEVDEREKAIGFYKVAEPEKAKAKTPKYILDEFKVRDYGKFAVVIARFSFGSKTDSEKPPVNVGRVVFAMRKEKGDWKIYSAQFTPFPPSKKPVNQ